MNTTTSSNHSHPIPQEQHMRELIDAYDRVGVAHLELARDAEQVEAPEFGDYNPNVAHHRTMAERAFHNADIYTNVLKHCIEKKFKL